MITHIKKYNIKFSGFAFMLLLFLSLSSCDDLLDADNPNNLLEEDLSDARAFGPMVNGLEATVVRAHGNIYASYHTATDEMIWVGSRDAYQQLNFGFIADPLNEFSDGAFPFVAEARWWGDEVIRRGEAFRSAGTLLSGDEENLARAYMYTAALYIMLGDIYDDFVINSNKREAGTPVGESNMNSLYGTAETYINNALALDISGSLETALTALMARSQFSRGIWAKVNPVNTADPLVSSAEAAATATSALGMMDADYKFKLQTDPGAVGTVAGLDIGAETNDRNEISLSAEYVILNEEGKQVADLSTPETSISLMDPIDDVPDPALYTNVKEFTEAVQYPDYTIVSAREMHLILAEHALANDDMDGFTTSINNLRALDGLSEYSGQMDAMELLQHARRVNFFLQGRRLADHYRFDDPSPFWVNNSDAVTNPGTFFPIAITEIRANPNIN